MYSKNKQSKFSLVRYKFTIYILRFLTPNLYRKMLLAKVLTKDINFFSVYPRPSIKRMKKIFNSNKVIGVEIGVEKGRNALSILKELNIKKLSLIDVWSNYEGKETLFNDLSNYNKVIKRFGKNNKVQIIKNTSIEGSKRFNDKSLDFVYIDANHSYKYVYDDLKAWYPKVKDNGILSGHDIYQCYDVLKALKDFCCIRKLRFYIDLPDWYLIKEVN